MSLLLFLAVLNVSNMIVYLHAPYSLLVDFVRSLQTGAFKVGAGRWWQYMKQVCILLFFFSSTD